MKKLFLFIAFIFSVAVFSQNQQQGQLLEKAYKKKSKKLLKEFFENWHQEIKSINSYEYEKMNDTLVETYKVFTEFYNPVDLERIGGSEWGGDIYKKSRYLIVQNSIKIYFKDTVYYSSKNRKSYYPEKRVLTDSIMNFRPIIDCCEDKTPVFLTKDYYNLLNAFLGNESIPLGTGGIMNPAKSKGESEKRKKFLEKQIAIWYGHWGGYWQLISYPKGYSVTFDKEMKYARVDFRMVYQGGEAFLKNENGKWTLISGKLTWIE